MLNRIAELVRRKQPLPQLASNDLQECHEWAVMAELAIQLLARTGQLIAWWSHMAKDQLQTEEHCCLQQKGALEEQPCALLLDQ